MGINKVPGFPGGLGRIEAIPAKCCREDARRRELFPRQPTFKDYGQAYLRFRPWKRRFWAAEQIR